MMMTLRKYSTIWVLLGILVLIFLSGYGLDYSALNNFSPSMVIDTVKGLLIGHISLMVVGKMYSH